MIKVKIKLSGVLYSSIFTDNLNKDILELPSKSNVETLLTELGFKKMHHRFIKVLINGKQATLDTILNDNNEINLSLLIGGG